MQNLKNILQSLLSDKIPGYKEKQKELEVFECWERAVGEKVAKNSRPIRLSEDGTLLIASKNNSWLTQLRYLETLILENLERELKDKRVKQLKFRLEMPSGS